mmetsp:Transcript_26254/g.40079  ORF Transcript_26254/g.40079 Transcript_26254/m.40079 type:complete len:81 (+) Transcript_26254:42-284(+)
MTVASLAVNATLEQAYGQGNKTIYEAQAVQATIGEVVKKQADSFKIMKANLTFENDDIMKYQQHTLVKDYTEGRISLHIK